MKNFAQLKKAVKADCVLLDANKHEIAAVNLSSYNSRHKTVQIDVPYYGGCVIEKISLITFKHLSQFTFLP